MKHNIQRHSLVSAALLAGLVLKLVSPLAAQTFKTLYNFAPTDSNQANSDGAEPGGLILSSNTFYGTCITGGTFGYGTVFALGIDGSGFTTLYNFTGGSDGALPLSPLILSGGTLFGAASAGGNSFIGPVIYGSGALFTLNTDGTGFTPIYAFTALDFGFGATNGDGALPGGLVLLGGELYGVTSYGGSGGAGTLFTVSPDGTVFNILHDFGARDCRCPSADAGDPWPLVFSAGTLYGVGGLGGAWGWGAVFRVNTDGTGLRLLHSFTPLGGAGNSYNSDGVEPQDLIVYSNTLYGTTSLGGSGGEGTVFKVNTDGTGFKVLHNFNGVSSNTNIDGESPGGLTLAGNILYGTTAYGGSSGFGTLFSLNTDGTGFTVLHTFTGTNTDGANPSGEPIVSGSTLCGVARGGTSGSGAIFSISLPTPPPPLTISSTGANVILTWPTNATPFTLQCTTNLAPPSVWTTNSHAPVVINGLNTVTNLISGTQQFYRLAQ
jgi:uncharacterized repeat protein (TIGR03803 family)